MIAGTPAIDADYERCIDPGEWQIQYWWPLRRWMRVKVSRIMFGRAEPADPERTLDASGPLLGFQRQVSRKGLRQPVLDYLTEYGPCTMAELAAAMGVEKDNIYQAIRKHKTARFVEQVGYKISVGKDGARQYIPVYGLPGQSGAGFVKVGSAQEFLAQHAGEWYSAAAIASALHITRQTVDGHLRKLRKTAGPSLETWQQDEIKNGFTYHVTYYRWHAPRQED